MRTAIDPEKFMEGLRSGFTPRVIISGKQPGGVRVRGTGSYSAYRAYCVANPEWGREAMELAQKNLVAANKRKGRPLTYCRRGHLLAGDNLAFKKHVKDGKFYRYCKACHRLRATWANDMTPGEVRQVTAAVRAGFKIQDITRSAPDRQLIVGFAKLKQYRVTHPEFDRFIIQNATGVSRAQLMQFRIVPTNAKFEYCTPAIIKPARKDISPFVMRDDDMAWVLSLIPRSVPDYARYDVMQDVFVALSAREISRDEVPQMVRKQAGRYVQRESDGRDPTRPWSLDVPAYREGSMLRTDTASSGLWD